MPISYSNPRMKAVIEDWPIGQHRTRAIFSIEQNPKKIGQRACRVTVNPNNGALSSPKKLTYALISRIVDGDDGKTYVLNLTSFGHISVFQGNMQYNEEAIFENDPRYNEIKALFDPAKA